MSSADIVALAAFMAIVLLGLAWLVLQEWYRNLPGQVIRQRLREVSAMAGKTVRDSITADFQRARKESRRRRRRQALGHAGHFLNRLDVVAGRNGFVHLVLLAAGVALACSFLLLSGFVPFHWWSALLAFLALPLLFVVLAYRWLLARFRRRFLVQLPDALDTIVRASQAGVPVTQSIRTVGQGFAAPLGPEFLKMGDGLLLGNELQEVMDEAVQRIELPDFSFFSVCVLLQRESGGSVAEALTNLAAIIRARRDLALKSRAMTAEGRLSGMVLSLLPLFIAGALYFTNPDYISVLFDSELGRQLLWLSAGMLVVGVLFIRKLSQIKI
ncbi:type II secretion system F family protein [Castellaniella hirudinis]|uniref:type II secretion system F family protein n=1 Tax=Castellaniella hirudinis TaxID=1144617 RepID=UPI0039C473F8